MINSVLILLLVTSKTSGRSTNNCNHNIVTNGQSVQSNARLECERLGGSLAVMKDANTTDTIIAVANGGTDYWIGGSKL